MAAFGRRFLVELADGSVLDCVSGGKKRGVACGDRVSLRESAPGQGVIGGLAPRGSLLYRSDPYRTKIIAANVNQVAIVLAAVPSFYEDLLNRCLVAAEAGGIKALIVLNKRDLTAETAEARQRLALYRDLGYPVVELSAKRDVAPLRPYLEGHTSVLVGQSGMGKSSIVNALLPQAAAGTGDISRALDSGRHTTTYTRLYRLGPDSRLIDSPGLQEFGLHHLLPDQIDHAFVEFRPYLGRCRFANCRHLAEPGCAVAEAAARGLIAPRRLAAYQRMVGASPARG